VLRGAVPASRPRQRCSPARRRAFTAARRPTSPPRLRADRDHERDPARGPADAQRLLRGRRDTGHDRHGRRDFVAELPLALRARCARRQRRRDVRGRPARRYVYEEPKSGQREEYYLDAATGAPLGSITEVPGLRAVTGARDGKPLTGPSLGKLRSTVVVARIERLAPTPANLAHVRERG
jgi:hypothetical protein